MDMLLPEHRHRIGMDLQNLTTPTAKNLVAGMFSKREKERPSAGLMIPLCHVHSKPSVLFTITDEDKQHESCRCVFCACPFYVSLMPCLGA